MKRLILTLASLALLGGAALAQDAPPPPPPGAVAPEAGGPPPPPPGTGPGGMRHGPGGPGDDRRGPPPPPPGKAARFTVDLGEGRRIDVKCADDEPMKACADIAAAMLDRIAPPRP